MEGIRRKKRGEGEEEMGRGERGEGMRGKRKEEMGEEETRRGVGRKEGGRWKKERKGRQR